MLTVHRFHDISCGHRVVGHEGKCRFLHGHNYRITFTATAEHGLDTVGRVVDFSVLKSRLCIWLEEQWDHKMLLWEKDPLYYPLVRAIDDSDSTGGEYAGDQLVRVPFNPTAENMANHLLRVVAPDVMRGTGAHVIAVRVDETRKCAAVADFNDTRNVTAYDLTALLAQDRPEAPESDDDSPF